MGERKVVLGCDPGRDDAITIVMAAEHPAVDLLDIAIAAGNQTPDRTLVNGLDVCQELKINVPVYVGMPQPVMCQQIVADNIHGETELNGPVLELLTRQAGNTHAVKYIINTLMVSDGDVTLMSVGSLLNIAVAMRMQPTTLLKIRETVLMGGAYSTGSFTPFAEFDISADSKVTRMVFTSGVPLVMMSLDLTNQATYTPGVIARMKRAGGPVGELFSDIMNFTLKAQFGSYDLVGGPVHNATCIDYLINPDGIETQEAYVEADVNNGPCYGHTVYDELGVLGKPVNTKVGITTDTDWF